MLNEANKKVGQSRFLDALYIDKKLIVNFVKDYFHKQGHVHSSVTVDMLSSAYDENSTKNMIILNSSYGRSNKTYDPSKPTIRIEIVVQSGLIIKIQEKDSYGYSEEKQSKISLSSSIDSLCKAISELMASSNYVKEIKTPKNFVKLLKKPFASIGLNIQNWENEATSTLTISNNRGFYKNKIHYKQDFSILMVSLGSKLKFILNKIANNGFELVSIKEDDPCIELKYKKATKSKDKVLKSMDTKLNNFYKKNKNSIDRESIFNYIFKE